MYDSSIETARPWLLQSNKIDASTVFCFGILLIQPNSMHRCFMHILYDIVLFKASQERLDLWVDLLCGLLNPVGRVHFDQS